MADHMENEEKKRGISKPVVAGAVAVAVVVGAIGVQAASSNRKNSQSTQITSETVVTGDVIKTVTGTGTLTADKTSKVIAPIGLKVTEVYVEKGDSVKKGDKIAKVSSQSLNEQLLSYKQKIDTLNDEIDELDSSDNNYDLEKQVKLGQIDEYNDAIEALEKVQKDKYIIKANADGIVDVVNLTEGSAITQSYTSTSTPSGTSTQDLISSFMQGAVDIPANMNAASIQGRTVLLLSDGETGGTEPEVTPSAEPEVTQIPESSVVGTDSSDSASDEENVPVSQDVPAVETDPATPSDESDKESERESETTSSPVLNVKIPVGIIPPITGTKPQTSLGTTGDLFDADITWDLEGETFEANKVYTAQITLRAKNNITFGDDFGITVSGATVSEQVKEKDLRVYSVTFPETSRSISDLTQEELEKLAKLLGVSVTDLLSSGLDLSSLASGFDLSSLSSSLDLSSLSSGLDISSLNSSSTLSSGSSTEAVVLTVLSADNMKLEIEVDELDILSVKEGQTANITIDALGDTKTFEGTITKIADIATEGSSSSKYTVSLEVPKTDEMKFGMRAKAVIEVEHRDDVLTLSMDAVQSANGVNYVYTTVDNDGNLSGETEIVTGVSDEGTVEIISGVQEGTEVFYKDLSNRTIWNYDMSDMTGGGGDEE